MRVVIFCIIRRISSKTTKPAAMMAAMTIRLAGVRKINSKKSRMRGMTKAAAIIPIIEIRRPARSLLRGLEIQ